MKFAVITLPTLFDGEAGVLSRLFEAGLPLLHLRKPGCQAADVGRLLRDIPACYHGRIALHDCHSLASAYGIGGLHVNARNPSVPAWFGGRRSCSCHSLSEVAMRKDAFDYVFLSPIYDSVSKEGYRSRFSPAMLADAAGMGIIDSKVYALGGVDAARIPRLANVGFGGAAVLGSFWGRYREGGMDSLLRYLAQCLDACQRRGV